MEKSLAGEDLTRFSSLVFDDYRVLAKDRSLSVHEKVGFPNSYREGKGELILTDIVRKADNLQKEKQTVLEIGPGCGELATLMVEHCRRQKHRLIMVDSEEMLEHHPDEAFITKVPGRFPVETPSLFEDHAGGVDAVICYGVLQVVFQEGNWIDFFDRALELLADGGQLLIGDLPNVSKRKRFFASPAGVRFHQEFMQTDQVPNIDFSVPEPGQMDDALFLALVMRARAAGYDGYWLPQAADLPMANRREDLLVHKP